MATGAEAPAKRLNVLHIVSDDLAARLGCYGDGMVKSPNIDALAARGVRFERAYCQFPLCNPSRASFMTGLRPKTTGVLENQTNFRDVRPEAVTIPQAFRNAGYRAARVGKLYHYGVPRQIGTSGMDDPASWEEFVNPRGRDMDDIGLVEMLTRGPDGKPTTRLATKPEEVGGTVSWLAAEGTDAEQTDAKGTAAAVELLGKYAASKEPFYLAVGFFRPHTPYVAPKAYFDLYPLESIVPPVLPEGLDARFPAQALASRKGDQTGMDDDLRRRAIQAYFAATTFMDAQVGQLLEALARLGLAENTIVVFHSDHGYHLGEKDLWQKMSLFEESARVPLIISVPGNPANGSVSPRPVELVALSKTLTELCDIPGAPGTEGHSMAPLVAAPDAAWEHAAYSVVSRGTKGAKKEPRLGRSVRTERWRYTEWNDGADGVELYDHEADPGEMSNVAGDPARADDLAAMKKLLAAE